jgi:hypothetical protein
MEYKGDHWTLWYSKNEWKNEWHKPIVIAQTEGIVMGVRSPMCQGDPCQQSHSTLERERNKPRHKWASETNS